MGKLGRMARGFSPPAPFLGLFSQSIFGKVWVMARPTIIDTIRSSVISFIAPAPTNTPSRKNGVVIGQLKNLVELMGDKQDGFSLLL